MYRDKLVNSVETNGCSVLARDPRNITSHEEILLQNFL